MKKLVVTVLLILTVSTSVAQRQQTRPNIVFILVDDLRWDELGIELDHMDELYDLKADPFVQHEAASIKSLSVLCVSQRPLRSSGYLTQRTPRHAEYTEKC